MHELGRMPMVVSAEELVVIEFEIETLELEEQKATAQLELAVIVGPMLFVVVQMVHPVVEFDIAGGDIVVPEMWMQ